MEERRDLFRHLRAAVSPDLDEIVRWQMTGILLKKTPVVNKQPFPRCEKCLSDWHGLPTDNCAGSFDTPGN